MSAESDVFTPGLLGSINHVAIAVSDLAAALRFFTPLLSLLGYDVGPVFRSSAGDELTVNINRTNGTGLNIWQAKPELASRPHEMYAPGFHHLAFNVERREQVDAAVGLLRELGAEILEGPGEYPFGPGGYYAVYFLGPDRLKFEIVHMPLAESRYRSLERRLAGAGWTSSEAAAAHSSAAPRAAAPVRFSELLDAFEFVSVSDVGEHQAFVDRRSGEFHFHSDLLDEDEEGNQLPPDIEADHYLPIPNRHDLGLGRRVALDFARECMPSHYDEVRDIFSRRGAYRRFRTLLERTRMLERWYDFSNKAEAAALREWCEECELEVSD